MDAPRRATGETRDLALLGWALALSAVLELAILRTFTRTAVHIPAVPNLRGPYTALTHVGEYAYYASVALLLPVVVLVAAALYRRAPVVIVPLVLFAAAALVALVVDSARALADTATVTSIVLLSVTLVAVQASWRAALPLAGFGLAFGASGWFSVSPTLLGGGEAWQPAWLLEVVEAAGITFALSSPLLVQARYGRRAALSAAAVGVFVLAVFLGNGSTSRFLLLWNVGLSGTFPSFLYAAAAAALMFAIAGLVRQGRPLAAAGLVLVIAGGIGLHSTYQSGLVVAGLGLLLSASYRPLPGETGTERPLDPDPRHHDSQRFVGIGARRASRVTGGREILW